MIFDGIIGHNGVKASLMTAMSEDKISHAYIFAGKRGVGKTMTAYALANALTSNSIADIITVTNEKYDSESKSEALSVKAIRGASADMYVKPYSADKKVFIIKDAEKMTTQAQNALLKVFEEPPSYCIIILITQNDNMLLGTIRSRAVTLRFGRLSDSDVENYAKANGINASPVLVRLAAGSIGMVTELCKDDEAAELTDDFIRLFGQLGSKSAADIYRLIEYLKKEKKNYELLFDVMLIMLEDTMLGKKDGLSIDGIDRGKAVRLIETVENTRNSFSYNANYDLAVSEMLLNILGAIND